MKTPTEKKTIFFKGAGYLIGFLVLGFVFLAVTMVLTIQANIQI